MKVVSDLYDGRINSTNLLIELTIDEYLNLARDILHKNEFQRRRVKASRTIYSLLRADLQRGCIIPPVVLALTSDLDNTRPDKEHFDTYLEMHKQHLVILDGLQRTWSMLDLIDELEYQGDDESISKLLAHKIRAEFYIGLNRIGILYRMLTLNTGQTPMSLRQQIEILYLDYADASIDGIQLVREAEDRQITRVEQYRFSDVIEGFNSYLDRNESPIDRTDLLENIQSLEKLSKENSDTDLFRGYLRAWHAFMTSMLALCGETSVSPDFQQQFGDPFGKNVQQVFKKAQALSGFGAAIGKLKDFGLIQDFDSVVNAVQGININDAVLFMDRINRNMDWIKNNTKKIGSAQRSYFQYLFREILNRESDNYLKPEIAADAALRKYQTQNI